MAGHRDCCPSQRIGTRRQAHPADDDHLPVRSPLRGQGAGQLAPDCQITAIAMLTTVSNPIVAHTHVATASALR